MHRRLVDAAIVQQIDGYGIELYAQYRLYWLDRNGEPGIEDINVGTIGARVTFKEGPLGQPADACIR
jgi:hypothetical protein